MCNRCNHLKLSTNPCNLMICLVFCTPHYEQLVYNLEIIYGFVMFYTSSYEGYE